MKSAVMRDHSSSQEIVSIFVNAIEAKDPYTQGHSHHVSVVAKAILDCLPPEIGGGIDPEKLVTAALLHDVGKILTPNHVLNREGALNDEEWAVMRRHPQDGKNILAGSPFEELSGWILCHHERMDGRGYYGLRGGEIPRESRIIAIADTFSALRTYRVYRPAKSIGETVRILRECAGAQLDALMVEHFLTLGKDVLEKLECGCEICKQRRRALETA